MSKKKTDARDEGAVIDSTFDPGHGGLEPLDVTHLSVDAPARQVAVHEQLIGALEMVNPDALLLEPRESFDLAVVGLVSRPRDHWGRKSDAVVALYDSEVVVRLLCAHLDCGWDEAVEFYGVNTSGAWCGDGTPTFSWDLDMSSGLGNEEEYEN